MSIFSVTAEDFFQKNLVKTHSEITYKGDVTLTVKINLSPGLREVKAYGDLRKIFTNLLTLSKEIETAKFRTCIWKVSFSIFILSLTGTYSCSAKFRTILRQNYIDQR